MLDVVLAFDREELLRVADIWRQEGGKLLKDWINVRKLSAGAASKLAPILEALLHHQLLSKKDSQVELE